MKECIILMSLLSCSLHIQFIKKPHWFFFSSIKRIWPLLAASGAHCLSHDPFASHRVYHSSLLSGPSAPILAPTHTQRPEWSCQNENGSYHSPAQMPAYLGQSQVLSNGPQGPLWSDHLPFPLWARFPPKLLLALSATAPLAAEHAHASGPLHMPFSAMLFLQNSASLSSVSLFNSPYQKVLPWSSYMIYAPYHPYSALLFPITPT